jgi:hypothetical protein
MEPSFTRRGALLVPSPVARSPWSDDTVNGHHIAGLCAWGVERDHHDDELQLARLTIDMFRPVPMKPLAIATKVVRAGRRLRVVDVSILDGDLEVTRGSVLQLRRGPQPTNAGWAPEAWDMPDPETFPSQPSDRISWEIRLDRPYGNGRGRVWLREQVPFVAGEELQPTVRAALCADFANPLANSGPSGLDNINADLSFNLVRDPVGEWIGMEAVGHLGVDGVSSGSAWMYDREGRIGIATVSGITDGRLRSGS